MIISAGQPLTARQGEILTFIRDYIAEHEVSPSYREIGAAFGGMGITAVLGHLKALEKKGAIHRATLYRGWVPTAQAGCCPTCGRPMEK